MCRDVYANINSRVSQGLSFISHPHISTARKILLSQVLNSHQGMTLWIGSTFWLRIYSLIGRGFNSYFTVRIFALNF